MSGTPEDEAKARLEVAQLYEGMPGQAAKASRYYFAAAEIFRGAGLMSRAREIYQKVVQLDPANAQAQQILQSIIASAGGTQPAAPPAAVSPPPGGEPPAGQAATRPAVQPPRPPATPANAAPATPAPPSSPASGGNATAAANGTVMVPTPWVGREARYIAAARAQLQVPPDRFKLPFDPLPPVDPAKVAARAEMRRKAQDEINRKSRTRVESVFDAGASRFGGGKPAAPTSTASAASAPAAGAERFKSAEGTPGAPAPSPIPKAPQPAADAKPAASRFGQPSSDLRGGNRDLADAIRRKLQGG